MNEHNGQTGQQNNVWRGGQSGQQGQYGQFGQRDQDQQTYGAGHDQRGGQWSGNYIRARTLPPERWHC